MSNFINLLFNYVKENKLIKFIKYNQKNCISINIKNRNLLLNDLLERNIIKPKDGISIKWATFSKQLNNYNIIYIGRDNNNFISYYYNNHFHPKSSINDFNKIIILKRKKLNYSKKLKSSLVKKRKINKLIKLDKGIRKKKYKISKKTEQKNLGNKNYITKINNKKKMIKDIVKITKDIENLIKETIGLDINYSEKLIDEINNSIEIKKKSLVEKKNNIIYKNNLIINSTNKFLKELKLKNNINNDFFDSYSTLSKNNNNTEYSSLINFDSLDMIENDIYSNKNFNNKYWDNNKLVY